MNSLFSGPSLPKSNDTNYHVTYSTPPAEVLLVTALDDRTALYIKGVLAWEGGKHWRIITDISLRKLCEHGIISYAQRFIKIVDTLHSDGFPKTLTGVTLTETP
jgi:hypothetical protein